MKKSLHNLGMKYLQMRKSYSLEKENYERKKCVWFGLMYSNSVENLIAIKPKNQKRKSLKQSEIGQLNFTFPGLRNAKKINKDRGKSL